MTKIKDLAKLLSDDGVRIGEEFGISGKTESAVFRLTDHAFEWKYDAECSDWMLASAELIMDILLGKRQIIQRPLRPKNGDAYFIAGLSGVAERVWCDGYNDYAFYYCGNCFRTREEAEANKDEIISRLKYIYNHGRGTSEINVVEAAKAIKEYCKEQGTVCRECKFADKRQGKDYLCLIKSTPEEWDI